eukprot:4521752-Pleurochrysis_carterae.AAC.1
MCNPGQGYRARAREQDGGSTSGKGGSTGRTWHSSKSLQRQPRTRRTPPAPFRPQPRGCSKREYSPGAHCPCECASAAPC